jgi:hypothetical protein
MAASTLSGSSFPLSRGGFVVTVECPNAYSHQRLMQALNNIVPDAGTPPQAPAREEHAHGSLGYMAGFEPNEDGVIVPGCANGQCGVD